MRVVGRNVPRKDSLAKVSGEARYVDDVTLPGLLHATTVRSTVPSGRIRDIHLAFDSSGFTIVDHRAIPGENVIALIERDQPCLVAKEVRHQAEPILLVAHADRERLLDVRVDIDYDQTPPVLDPLRSTESVKSIEIAKGDLTTGFTRADVIVEGEYRTGAQEHVYIEPNGMIAVPEDGGVTIMGSLQCPYYVQKALATLLALPEDRVRVKALECGGAFGGKEDYPSIIAGHAALLALAAGRPVKLVYDRREDMLATTKRHPSVVRHRTGVTRDGRITAMDIEVVLDAGAYVTLSPVVLSRGVLHATGPYATDHVRVRGRAMRTNLPPFGAFRGFGAPQTQLAAEAHLDRIAEAIGLDPVRVREVNAFKPGDTTATGQTLGDDCTVREVLREAVERTDYHRKRAAWPGTGRGIGLALFFHGAGFTGSGEEMLASKASLALTERGVEIRVSSTEMGQGTRTMLAQIVAETLDVPYDTVAFLDPDTAQVPDTGPTVASRTCMVVGEILRRAAEGMKARLAGRAPADHFARHGGFVVTESYANPAGITWDETTYTGDAYATYAWGADVAEVALDPDTYEVRPLKLTAVVDIGKAIHPVLARGQIEGGTAQAVGWALNEEVRFEDGRMANPELTNYAVPTTADTPEIDAVLLETPFKYGPFGAKGIGELPMDGPAPALLNAIRHAGVDLRAIPATPERILEARCDST
jgi:CO/xanthine dehydrogenase Mo-binding subunit